MPSIVRTPLALHLWSQAQTHLEWAATRFWEHIIRGEFPVEDNWVVASQQPPTDDPQDRKRVELVVDKWKGKSIHRLFIFEAKKKNASQTEIDYLEYQAYEACVKHLNYSRRKQMYAMTVIGTLARIWVMHIDEDYLTPWISMDTSLGDKSGYIEAHSNEGSMIEEGINYMKKNEEMSQEWLDALRRSVRSAVETNLPTASYVAGPSGSGSGASYTTTYPIREVLTASPEAKAKAEEHYPVVPADAIYVEVKLEVKETGDLLHFYDGDQHYAKTYSDWEERTVIVEGKSYECFLYTGRTTGKHFWTYSLRDVEEVETRKGKGKGKEKKK